MLERVTRFIKRKLWHPDRLYVFNFHQVSDAFDPTRHSRGTWTSTEHLRTFIVTLKQVARIASLSEGLEAQASGMLRGFWAAITFDDGHHGVVKCALPVLESEGVPFTMFVNTGYADSKTACWTDASFVLGHTELEIGDETRGAMSWVSLARNTADNRLYKLITNALENAIVERCNGRRDYVTADEVLSIRSDFVDIGLHGHEHHRMSMLTLDEQRRMLLNNKSLLESARRYRPLFALPFGRPHDYTVDTLELCREHGVMALFHNGGYNVSGQATGRRIASDSRDVLSLINGQAARPERHDFNP